MTKVVFGIIEEEVKKSELRERFASHRSYIKEIQPEKWKLIPHEFHKGLESALYLHTHHLRDLSGEVIMQAEWDNVESYKFRGEVLWSAKSSTGTVTLKHLSNPWIMAIAGEWDVAPRFSKVLFGKLGQISKVTIPYGVLQKVIDDDAKVEYKGKWNGIEAGIDGSLEGPLPRSTGTRSDFDGRGQRSFARFESYELGHVISISCEKGYLSSNAVTSEELIGYFEARIQPQLQLPRRFSFQ